MLSKKNLSKKFLCTAIALVVLMSCFSFNIFADTTDSKTVTVTDYTTVNVLDSQIAATIGSLPPNSPSTKYYNDGQYKGTLYFQSSTLTEPPRRIGTTNLWELKMALTYTGTVTRTIVEKTVTVTDYTTVYVPDSQIAATIGSLPSGSPSTKYYNDGQYSGTLYFKSSTLVEPPKYIPTTRLYELKMALTYTGTVQKYN